MVETSATSMDAIEIDDFLSTQRTGVLALADEGDAYAIPVSFTHDSDDRALFFRFGFAPGSQKEQYLDATDHATFVVYDETPVGWKSVIATGRVERLPESGPDSAIVEAIRQLEIPYFKVFERPATDITFEIGRLEIEDATGIVEGGG